MGLLRYVLSAAIFYFTFSAIGSWNAMNAPGFMQKQGNGQEIIASIENLIDYNNETVSYVAAEFTIEELVGINDESIPVIFGENTFYSFISMIDVNTLSDKEMLALAY